MPNATKMDSLLKQGTEPIAGRGRYSMPPLSNHLGLGCVAFCSVCGEALAGGGGWDV